jgi:zinc protease
VNVRRLTLLLVLAGCSSAKPTAAPPVAPVPAPSPPVAMATPVEPMSEPPPSGFTPTTPFPPVTHRRLANGLELAVLARSTFPVVELRLIVRSGQATDGERPGLAALTGRLLKDGGAGRFSSRELAERSEALGSRLSISTDRDSTRIGLGVTKGDLAPALEILDAVARTPRFSAEEFKKLRQREIDRVKDRARTSPGWLGAMALYRELYQLPVSVHPYARFDALPAELGEIQLEEAKRWYKTHVTPENSVLVVAGDVDVAEVERAANQWLGRWRGPKPAPESFPEPHGPETRELFVVDRPGSSQSQVLVGTLGPERAAPAYPALMAANQIVGGGTAGRLFLDVREKRSLAYSTSSWVEEPAHGPMPMVLSAGTQTAKTSEAVAALLEHFARLGDSAPSEDELQRATRFLSDSFLFKMETAGALADLQSRLIVLGLPDETYDEYRRAVRDLDMTRVASTASRYFKKGAELIVVVGDASVVAKPLARFAKVSVLDPERDFSVKTTLPKE